MSLFHVHINGRDILFCHIPKTGGTSIRRDRQVGRGRRYTPNHAWLEFPAIAFVRNPYDRMESLWRDWRYARERTELDLTGFLRSLRMDSRRRIDDPNTAEHHAAAMVDPVHGMGAIGDAALGRYETFDEDWQRFCDFHGIRCPPLPRHRSTADYPRAQWTPEAVGWVNGHHTEDFERFGYERRAG
jgi:hypothetical protein